MNGILVDKNDVVCYIKLIPFGFTEREEKRMDFIKEKIRVMVDKLNSLRTLSSEPLSMIFCDCPVYKSTNLPPEEGWLPFTNGERFSGIDTHFWLHLTIPPVEAKKNCELRLSVKTGREGQWDAQNPQFTVFVDGDTATQALDVNHTWLPLSFESEHDIYLYLYTGMLPGRFDCIPSLEIVDLDIEALYYDIKVPYLSMLELDEHSYDYTLIRDCLDRALTQLDLRDVYSSEFYDSVHATSEYMKREFYEGICGKSESSVSCIGHTHIDVAWLWTVAQTREKAQRSFATVINMMDRYDDYRFMSSQPQLYQHVKESDPALYEKIRARIRESRWEAEGAMWLEADTNLISGESLVRQILYGKRFMREEFGVENKILWLPDVFGYSAALPQILQKSGVTQFFTTKMYWNETNSMPNDTFIWEGLDGSSVFASFIHAYDKPADPKTIAKCWREYKNKSISNNVLLTFGYGDGGGGPTCEMMETLRRMKHGIPGMPQTKIETAGTFFDRLEREFIQKTNSVLPRPRWKGEMYLEMHRGTYTSVAKNKRNNRKSELLYQLAEALAATDLLAGGVYPEEILRRNIRNILLNQFHDIIPGSSIGPVYDVTDAEYAHILAEGNQIVEDKLAALAARIKTGGGILVYNPSPFAVTDDVLLDGKYYHAEDIPSHGYAVIQAVVADTDVSVGEKYIENSLVRVTFDEAYQIISIFDKEQQREVLAPDAVGNRLEVFEDYPRAFDAWEITDYYRQKMWVIDSVEAVEHLTDCIRITRNYGKSVIVQEISLRRNSKRIDFNTKIDWHEDHVLLKAAFPVDIHAMNATYDIQFGNIERPTHRNTSWDAAKFEVCAHKWADLSEHGYGVSILNDCKYGYSIEDNVMKLSLLKAATYPYPEADRGHHQFTYSLLPHTGDFREGGTVQEGYALNIPLLAQHIQRQDGDLPDRWSLVHTEQKNIVIETIKKAEDDNSIIVRFYEAYNQKGNVRITTGFDFRTVYLVDMMEENPVVIPHDERSIDLPVRNYEVITLKFVQ